MTLRPPFLILGLLLAFGMSLCAATPTLTPPPAGTGLILHPFLPNPDPFGEDGIYFPYLVSLPCHVEIRIFTITGQVVRDLKPSDVSAGENEAFWDGANDAGKPVASGVFLVRLSATAADGSTKFLFEKCAALR
jgi:hypothetical protein